MDIFDFLKTYRFAIIAIIVVMILSGFYLFSYSSEIKREAEFQKKIDDILNNNLENDEPVYSDGPRWVDIYGYVRSDLYGCDEMYCADAYDESTGSIIMLRFRDDSLKDAKMVNEAFSVRCRLHNDTCDVDSITDFIFGVIILEEEIED